MANIYGNLLKQKSVCIRKEFNSHSICLEHQHGRRFIVLGYQYGRRDVKWRHFVISAIWLFEKHSDVPYKPLKAVLARQIKIICSITCDSFFFRWAQFLLVKINRKGSLSCVILQHLRKWINWMIPILARVYQTATEMIY